MKSLLAELNMRYFNSANGLKTINFSIFGIGNTARLFILAK